MSDATANLTLELACTVGSIENAAEALEEGADINHKGGAPLFNAIFNRNVAVIRFLIDEGADLSFFIPPAKQIGLNTTEDIIDKLMECAPPDPKAIDPGLMGEMDATIRKSGLGKPILEGDWEGFELFVEKLEKIGAPELAKCVSEVVEMLRPAQMFGDAALFEAVKADKKKIAPLTERYLAVEGINVEEMARAFLDSQEGGDDPDGLLKEKPDSDSESVETNEGDTPNRDGDSGGDGVTAIAV